MGLRKESTMTWPLKIDGEVESSMTFSYDDLRNRPDSTSVSLSGRLATGIPATTLFKAVGLRPSASHITLHAEHDSFAASVPLDAVSEAYVIFEIDNAPIEISKGGPFRFFIPDAARCSIGGVDECANVKYLDRIELTAGPGKDTRPRTKIGHKELHEKQ